MKFKAQDVNSNAAVRFLSNLCLSLIIVVATASPSVANTPAPPWQVGSPSAQAIDASDEVVKALTRVRQTIDMETTSLESKAEKLNFDPLAAVAYVTDEIGFLPYPGSMRAEIGSMLAGSASALDQAMLLGGLLDLMGVDVVLAHGQLGSADTSRLMREVLNVKAPVPAIDNAKLNQLSLPSSSNSALQQQKGPSAKDIDSRLARIVTTLSPSLKPQTVDPLSNIRADVSEHYVWVRYRDLPTDPWVDVHPAFAKAAAPTPTVNSYSQVEVAQGRGHTFGFKLILEVTEKGKVRETTLVSFEPRQISKLAESQIDLTLVPSGMDPTNVSAGSKASYFIPVINGETPAGAKVFSPRGNVVSAAAVTSSQSGGAAASLFGDLSAKLGSTDPEGLASQPHVTGLWIEATYQSPLGAQKRRRPLIDLSTSKPGDLVSATDAMFRSIIDFNIGQTNMARAMDYHTSIMIEKIQRLPYMLAVATGGITMDEYNTEPSLLGADSREAWSSMAMLQEVYLPTRYQGQVALPLTALVSTMTMSTITGGDKPEVTMRGASDLMFTQTLVLKNDVETVVADRNAAMRLGIYRTLAEAIMVEGDMDSNPLTKAVGELTVFSSKESLVSLSKESALGSRTAVRLADDFKSAGMIVVSDTPDTSELRWWKIDQLTGEALGMGVLGGQATESAIIRYLSTRSTVSNAFLVVGFINCLVDYGSKFDKQQFAACMAINLVLYMAGDVIGAEFLVSKMAGFNVTMGLAIDVIMVQIGSGLQFVVDKGVYPNAR